MVDELVWYFSSAAQTFGLLTILRAAAVCTLLYQIDIAFVLARWLLARLTGALPVPKLEPGNCHPAVLVLPTLLRKEDELHGLMRAMSSAATNGYPAPLAIVACIDGCATCPDLCTRLRQWIESERLPPGVSMHFVGTPERMGKATAMDHGFELVKHLCERSLLPHAPRIFFNMDADSVLGERALERMVYKLTRRRRLARTRHLIVTSNVLVDARECFASFRDIFRLDRWLATLVGREYLSSISLGRSNTKIFPVHEASGALFCTWAQVYAAAPKYARFMQTVKITDWLKWWVGFAPPQYSRFDGPPLIEAMSGPGDDTWVTWLACSGRWVDGRVSFDFPRTPIHALWSLLVNYVSRPLSYDPLAKVYTKTPATCRSLFNQRLRWNSSRVQDLCRWMPSLAFHWTVGAHIVLGTGLVVVYTGLFLRSLFALLFTYGHFEEALALTILASAGYMLVRLLGTIVALIVAECPPADWLKLLSLPLSGPYHVVFNTFTTIIGFSRDLFGFGEPTKFSPEKTLRAGGLWRVALAYRLRRALLLACRSVAFGDVPLGWFWFGWRQTPYTPSGFDGWSSGQPPPPIFWPSASRAKPVPPSAGPSTSEGLLSARAIRRAFQEYTVFAVVSAAAVAGATGAACAACPKPLDRGEWLGKRGAPEPPQTVPKAEASATPRATWVWTRNTVVDPAERTALLAFSRAQHVSSLYVAYASDYDSTDGFPPLADLVRESSAQGVRVAWVAGDPAWTLASHHADARAVVSRMARINGRLRESGLPAIADVQFDVEPYMLEPWAPHTTEIEEQYVALMASLREATSGAGLGFWVTAPFWFDQQRFGDTTLDRALLRWADGMVVMAYRSTPAAIAAKAEGILRQADAVHRPVIVAVEIGCSRPQGTTLCGASEPEEMEDAIREVARRLTGIGSFRGLAVHDYSAWRQASLSSGAAKRLGPVRILGGGLQ